MNDCVILREIPTACGRRFGHATLNAPQRLNALSLEMIDRLAPQLAACPAMDADVIPARPASASSRAGTWSTVATSDGGCDSGATCR